MCKFCGFEYYFIKVCICFLIKCKHSNRKKCQIYCFSYKLYNSNKHNGLNDKLLLVTTVLSFCSFSSSQSMAVESYSHDSKMVEIRNCLNSDSPHDEIIKIRLPKGLWQKKLSCSIDIILYHSQ